MKLVTDKPRAATRRLFESGMVQYENAAPATPDNSGILERIDGNRDACAAHAQHCRKR